MSTLEELAPAWGQRWPQLVSALAYRHPLTNGGVVMVIADGDVPWLEIVGTVHRELPSECSRYLIRPRGLASLGLPGLFAPPLAINERPHLPFALRHRGRVLHGQDLRFAVVPDPNPRATLAAHIEGCTDYLRRYVIMTQLVAGDHERLARGLEDELRRLLATALLIDGIWDVDLETVIELFLVAHAGRRRLCAALRPWRGRDSNHRAPDAPGLVWRFERCLALIEELTR